MNGRVLSLFIGTLQLLNKKAMKKLLIFFVLFTVAKFSSAQDKEKVEKACINYIEGFYEGDTTKLIAALKPNMYKIGFWKNKTGTYDFDG